MATERVTVEQNGERFTLDVPEGTTDEQIKAFVAQQQGGAVGGALTKPDENKFQPERGVAGAVDYATTAMGEAAQNPNAQTYLGQAAASGMIGGPAMPIASPQGELFGKPNPAQMKLGPLGAAVADIPAIAGPLSKLSVGEAIKYVGKEGLTKSAADLAGAIAYPIRNLTVGGAVKGLGTAVAGGLMAPENLMTLPYNMAAYEQEKIRANPNAPGLEYNPYAQTVRGQAATQGQAGAANQMRAVVNQPYGNVSAQERAILDEDRMMKQAIRKRAFEKVMGPVVPGSF